jgi:hypothetical protein
LLGVSVADKLGHRGGGSSLFVERLDFERAAAYRVLHG